MLARVSFGGRRLGAVAALLLVAVAPSCADPSGPSGVDPSSRLLSAIDATMTAGDFRAVATYAESSVRDVLEFVRADLYRNVGLEGSGEVAGEVIYSQGTNYQSDMLLPKKYRATIQPAEPYPGPLWVLEAIRLSSEVELEGAKLRFTVRREGVELTGAVVLRADGRLESITIIGLPPNPGLPADLRFEYGAMEVSPPDPPTFWRWTRGQSRV